MGTILEQQTALAELKLNHPTRLRIALHLLENEKASPSEISKLVDESLGAVAYHVRTMSKAGLLRKAGERRVRGAVEHYYSLKADVRDQVVALAGAAA
jgi:DNA-binding transcriptional ArsR family regulator